MFAPLLSHHLSLVPPVQVPLMACPAFSLALHSPLAVALPVVARFASGAAGPNTSTS